MYTNTRSPLVSVVMATFNEPVEIITKAIESILNQTFTDFELIIIDDSSNVETKKAIDLLSKDKRVLVLREPERIGFVKSLNLGLSQAKGKFIARMDGDDISIENRFELQTRYLIEHPSVSVVGGSIIIVDETDRSVSFRKYPTSPFALKWLSVFRTPLAHPTVMMRQEIIRNGFRYDDSYNKSEDLEFWLRLRKNGYKIANMSDFLLKYRICGDLSQKRVSNHWSYNFKARTKNFNLKDPIFSILSVMVSFSYTIMPKFIVKAVYNRENNKQKNSE